MNIIVREMRPEDVPAVYAMGIREEGFRAPGSEEKLCFWPQQTLERWTVDPGDDVLLVAEVDGEVAGFVIATFHRITGKAEWENECVSPEFRGRGVAKALYAEMERRFVEKGATFISFIVKGDNDSLGAYKKRFGPSAGVQWFVKPLGGE